MGPPTKCPALANLDYQYCSKYPFTRQSLADSHGPTGTSSAVAQASATVGSSCQSRPHRNKPGGGPQTGKFFRWQSLPAPGRLIFVLFYLAFALAVIPCWVWAFALMRTAWS